MQAHVLSETASVAAATASTTASTTRVLGKVMFLIRSCAWGKKKEMDGAFFEKEKEKD
jgi:hypothetical protein